MDADIKTVIWKYRTIRKKDGEMVKGEHEVRLRITMFSVPKYINIGFSSSLKNWDEQNEAPLPSHPKYKAIIKKIEELSEEIRFQLKLADKNGEEMIASAEIKKRVVNKPLKPSQVKILEFYDTVIAELDEQDRPGYADVMRDNKGMVKKLLPKDKPFIAFTKEDAEKLEQALISGNRKETTIAYFLRTYYRIWNIAIERGYCSKYHHPKNYIRFKAYRKIKTKKRAISAAHIKAIEDLQFDYESRLFRSQQYFLFSYYTRGINFMDMIKLKHGTNIKGNEIRYKRSKNRRDYEFILHKKSLHIINIFKHYPLQSDDGRIFPILMAMHDTAKKIIVREESALKDLNEDLKEMARQAEIPKVVSSYVARHSFATNLRRANVQISMIQEAMGHETETQTMTYLEEFDEELLAQQIEVALP